MRLRFHVTAGMSCDSLAAFQYREWAEEWRDRYCATGAVVECSNPITAGNVIDLVETTGPDGSKIFVPEPNALELGAAVRKLGLADGGYGS